MSRKHIPCPYSIFHLQKTYSMSTQHILSPEDIQHVHTAHTMSPEHTYSIHIHPRGSGPRKFKFSTFSQICPVTFGLCLGIITDTFHGVFEFSKNIFVRNLFVIIFLIFFRSNNPNNPSNILKNCLKQPKLLKGPPKGPQGAHLGYR